MAHALLISNDELVSSLLPLNINLYVGFDVTLKNSWEDAKKLLDARLHIDLIISIAPIAPEIFNYLTNEKLEIPLIVIGEYLSSPSVLVIKNRLNVQELLKTIAKLFHISAKTMAEKVVPEYYPIPLKLLANLDKIPADVYLKSSSNLLDYSFSILASKGSIIETVVRNCKKNNVEILYIPSVDRLKVINEISSKILNTINNNLNLKTDEKLDLNEQGFELVCEHISDSQVLNEEIMLLHKTCIDSSREVVKKIPGIKDLLDILVSNKSGFVYTHSILISFVCNHIVKNISWGGQGHAEKLTYISFYHDLFLVPLFKKYPNIRNEEDLLYSTEVLPDEKDIILSHAKTVGDMISKFPRTPIGSDVLLRQHHGIFSGIGFAVDFKDDISPLAKVFIIAEAYVTEILKEQNYPFGAKLDMSKFNKKSAINLIIKKFPRSSYVKITETLEKVPI